MVAYACSCCGQNRDSRVIVERTSEWNASPVYPENLTASAQIVVFYSDGRFGVVNGIIGKSSREHDVSVLFSEGYSVFTGCWSTSGAIVKALAAVVYLPAPMKPMPEPQRFEYVFDGISPMMGKKLVNQIDRNRPIETIPDASSIAEIVESQTKAFESTNKSRSWRCSGSK